MSEKICRLTFQDSVESNFFTCMYEKTKDFTRVFLHRVENITICGRPQHNF